MNTCIIDDCNTKVHAKGLCMTHYSRHRRNGSPYIVQTVGKKAMSQDPSKSYVNRNDLIGKYKRRARRKELDWQLSVEMCENLFKSTCFYCGVEPKQVHGDYRETCEGYIYNGIDRVDNSVGYVKENVVACCKVCNRAKEQTSLKEFMDYFSRIVDKYS